MDIQAIKQRFGIIGNDPMLNRALEKSKQVAPTDISVLVIGESGVGKESIPKIIHTLSHRKHAKYIAVNCGAIPEGTIDSELFGHEKGAFTGATTTRQGYFEEADGGTIFLDEVGELPVTTQVRLLRVLENGEFMKVGSSKVQKTDIRIVAATNINMAEAIKKGKFREDLYYRLSTIEISLPPLRDRKGDIHLLFRKFAYDFAQKYHMPAVQLTDDAVQILTRYHFPGNIRQLRNIAEQLSVVETNRSISGEKLKEYLPHFASQLPSVITGQTSEFDYKAEREIIYNIIFEMRKELDELKKLTVDLLQSKSNISPGIPETFTSPKESDYIDIDDQSDLYVDVEDQNETHLTLKEQEVEMIKQSLQKHQGKRKLVAKELGISERTLYRKIKEFNL
ncbi:MAG: sigma-54-dependent Fis family transcriptional regulator [Flavobacteriia bacterium]|nr:MAG: sigma-54-dependent Fis family transcriptional regulator [Flavobacteriia bacterium]